MTKAVIKGMSCSHCEAAVKAALEELGLREVSVSLATESAVFQENSAVTREMLAHAIDEAGFQLDSAE